VNLTFFKTLGEKFPLLTENEKEVCGLIVLKLSSKDIASIRNITPNAVKKARQKIRQKLPITADQNLTLFLDNV
jgi:DNA-binding CsgD family transcriptional regulator